MKRFLTAVLSILICMDLLGVSAFAASISEIEETLNSDEIQAFIHQSMNAEAAPGVSIVVTNGEETVFANYGYSDLSRQISATENTVYQIGSVTKAFTALAVLMLEDEGLLSIDDRVSDYLPWFRAYYKGEAADITVKHLLDHSSGIPNKTMNRFEAGSTDDLKEKTSRLAEGIELNFAPGTDFEYCNLGYDILGYLIETVSGVKFEDYVREKILLPLGMTHSGFNIKSENNAKGYGQFFGKAIEYNAPKYQGCLADGYLMTTAADMALWLNAQLGKGDVPEQLRRLIEKSHDISAEKNPLSANDGTNDLYYGFGWNMAADSSYIMHSGLNPNFASQIFVSFEKETAVFAVSNIGGIHASDIGTAIYYDIIGKELPPVSSQLGTIDKAAGTGIIIEAVIFLLLLFMMMTRKKRLAKKQNIRLKKEKINLAAKLAVLIPCLIIAVLLPYLAGYTYAMGWIWMPKTVVICLAGGIALLLLLIVMSVSRYVLLCSGR